MIDFNFKVFGTKVTVPDDVTVIFVSDMFIEDYVGGAELTTEALVEAAPLKVFKLHSKDVTLDLLQQSTTKFWVFGNFSQLNPQLIPSIVGNLRYSIVEYDYKFCRFRSPELHLHETGLPCDCSNQEHGKLISAFFYGAMGLWWMSERQRDRYLTNFPFLTERQNTVLSSVFSSKTIQRLRGLRLLNPVKKDWVVLGSGSWIKGFEPAAEWCRANGHAYEALWNMPYDALLERLATAQGFAYLPRGGDTCPRMVIEAKLLGCTLQLNDDVQHKDEEWFATADLDSVEAYLDMAPSVFWDGIERMMTYRPTVSGYTTVYNCVSQRYPFKQCIGSMLVFCDEVCVVDGGSTDGTWEALMAFKAVLEVEAPDAASRLKFKQVRRDWKAKNHAVFDGMQKAEARAMCTAGFCWQMDCDEVVHEDDGVKVYDLCRTLNPHVPVLALPVIEYWGGADKVRMDVTPWKWRLSVNDPRITHGIPKELRRVDADGNLCASAGTDGCDMVYADTFERVPHATFYTADVDNVRKVALLGDVPSKTRYEQWFNHVVKAVPPVFHYSWYDLGRKIRLYRDYWTSHWVDLMGQEYVDAADTNMMFDVPWSQVTEEMIDARAEELKAIGGWVWHRKWDGSKTPWISVDRSQPRVML